MKTIQLFVALFHLSLLVSIQTGEEVSPANTVTIRISEVSHEIASRYHRMGWFSGSILVTKDGRTLFSKSYGYRDAEEKSKNTHQTKYNLGSIMKHFTKVLVLQQIEAGNVSLEDTLDTFELGFPTEFASIITVEQLLNHRSGFADIFVAEYRENQLSFDTIEKKLQLLRDKPLLFEPGTDYHYSNYGYIVLGAILERVTQSTFEDLLNSEIFEPVGMDNSSLHPEQTDERQSKRYTYLYDGSLLEVGITEHPGPDGGIEATASDVQKFYRELFYGDSLLNRNSPVVRKSFAMDGEHWAAYGGGLGISSAVEVDLKNGIEIVVLSNSDSLVAEFISGRIYDFIKDASYPKIVSRPINFTYDYYKTHGKAALFNQFRQHYEDSGYTEFIGRTVNELGMQLLRAESYTEAFEILDYLVHLFPEAPQAYDSLAFAYHKTGKPEKAKKVFSKALKRDAGFDSDYSSNNFGTSTD